MSVRLMAMVFDSSGFTSTQKLVLLALADHANEDGKSIYPSVARLCDKTALSERTVRQTLSDLRDTNGLNVIRIENYSTLTHPNEYSINVGILKSMTALPPAANAPGAVRAEPGAVRAEPPAANAPGAVRAEPGAVRAEPPAANAPKSSYNHHSITKDAPPTVGDRKKRIVESINQSTDENDMILECLNGLTGGKRYTEDAFIKTGSKLRQKDVVIFLRSKSPTRDNFRHFAHWWQVNKRWQEKRGGISKPSLFDVYESWEAAMQWNPDQQKRVEDDAALASEYVPGSLSPRI